MVATHSSPGALRRTFAGVLLLIAVGGGVLAGTAIFDLAFYSGYTLPGPSMEPAIGAGTHLWTRPEGGARVKSGDIVLLRPPVSSGLPSPVITRVVAVAGQTVAAHDGRLLVDGRPRGLAPTLPPGTAAVVTVPQNTVYVLGDNRPESLGSNQYGPVPIQNVSQRVVGIGTPTSAVLVVRTAAGLAVATLAALVCWRILRRRQRAPDPSAPVDPGPRPLWTT
ncbi:MAG: signal peptidase [Jatrophihabitans sp.]|nr:signal peptidase [Jatrophihabitans sp.]